MSALLWSSIYGMSGLVAGIVLGFVTALAWASALPAPNDGTFAMRQMVLCLPLGSALGLVAGIAWSLSR